MENSFSEKIKILRPLLILLVVITHIQGNLYRIDLRSIDLTWESFVHAFLSGVIAVIALPLLTIISGYLAGNTFNRYSYRKVLVNKFDRLIVPMLVWNFFGACYIFYMQSKGQQVRADLQLLQGDVINWFYALTGFFRLPANAPLYFLRELFICVLITPFLMRVAKSPILFSGFFVVITVMALKEINFNFFHRIDIYAFYTFGLFLFLNPKNKIKIVLQNSVKLKYVVFVVFICSAVSLTLYGFRQTPDYFIPFRKAMTLIGPLVLWLLASHIKGKAKQLCIWLSPISFTLFLGHVLFLNVYWILWINIFKSSPIVRNYGLYWVTALLFSLLAAATVYTVWSQYLKRISAK